MAACSAIAGWERKFLKCCIFLNTALSWIKTKAKHLVTLNQIFIATLLPLYPLFQLLRGVTSALPQLLELAVTGRLCFWGWYFSPINQHFSCWNLHALYIRKSSGVNPGKQNVIGTTNDSYCHFLSFLIFHFVLLEKEENQCIGLLLSTLSLQFLWVCTLVLIRGRILKLGESIMAIPLAQKFRMLQAPFGVFHVPFAHGWADWVADATGTFQPLL